MRMLHKDGNPWAMLTGPILRRKHLLRRPVWILSTGAAILAVVAIVGVITLLNGGF